MATTTESVRKILVDGEWYETGETLDVAGRSRRRLHANRSRAAAAGRWDTHGRGRFVNSRHSLPTTRDRWCVTRQRR